MFKQRVMPLLSILWDNHSYSAGNLQQICVATLANASLHTQPANASGVELQVALQTRRYL